MINLDLRNLVGDFTWMFGQIFFIETAEGNFLWRDPDYGGNGMIVPYEGTYEQYSAGTFGRSKGKHFVGDYCGNFKLVSQEEWDASWE